MYVSCKGIAGVYFSQKKKEQKLLHARMCRVEMGASALISSNWVPAYWSEGAEGLDQSHSVPRTKHTFIAGALRLIEQAG